MHCNDIGSACIPLAGLVYSTWAVGSDSTVVRKLSFLAQEEYFKKMVYECSSKTTILKVTTGETLQFVLEMLSGTTQHHANFKIFGQTDLEMNMV